MTWIPSVLGTPIELVDPTPAQVNFANMAWALAHTNRYSGHPVQPVSVGLHLLIGLDLAPPTLKALWLVHDGHEERTGDTTSPAKEALEVYAARLYGTKVAGQIAAARKAFEVAHDRAIHTAAGLDLPTEEQAAALKRLDLVCLATERRQFMRPCSRPWWIDSAGIEAAPKAVRWIAPDAVADKLLAAFQQHLPALKGQGRRAIR